MVAGSPPAELAEPVATSHPKLVKYDTPLAYAPDPKNCALVVVTPVMATRYVPAGIVVAPWDAETFSKMLVPEVGALIFPVSKTKLPVVELMDDKE